MTKCVIDMCICRRVVFFTFCCSQDLLINALGETCIRLLTGVPGDTVDWWYPNGYGDHPIYITTVNTQLSDVSHQPLIDQQMQLCIGVYAHRQQVYRMSLNGSLQSDGHTSTQSSIKFIGFRDVELVRDPLPDGETFYFRVNGDAVSHMHAHTCTHMHIHTRTRTHTHTHTHACTHTHTSLSSCRHSCFCQRRQPDSPGCL